MFVILALGSITMNKASRGNGIPDELFQILEDDDSTVVHSICLQLSSGHRTRKDQFLFQSQRGAMPKNAQTTTQSNSTDMNLSELPEEVMNKEAWRAAIHVVTKSWTRLSD